MNRFGSLACAVCSVAVPVLVSAQSGAMPAPAKVRQTLDSLAKEYVTLASAPGTAVAVVRGSDTLLFRGYGMANLELGTPVTVNSVFRIGSVTKQFTASAVLQLVEQGKLALTDTIGQWIPDLPLAWRGVTVTQLLNHTSGIPSYTDVGDAWVKRWGEEMTGPQLLSLVADKPVDFPRGTSWRYDNTGYVLLGMLLEARTGHSWGQDFSERFFTPLGMSRTRYCATNVLIPDRASGYSKNGAGPWMNATYLAMSQPHAAGALCSTIGDLLTWNRALHNGRVLKRASYDAMTTPQGTALERKYGFALGREALGTHTVLTHGGGINGFLTGNLFIPDAQLSVTVLTNSDDGGPDRLVLQLARAALGIPLEVPPKAIAITASELAAYTGTYDLVVGATRPFTFTIKDGTLIAQLEGQGPNAAIPLGNHTFGLAFDPTLRITFTMVDGKPTKVTLKQGGGTFEGVRRP